MTATSTRTIGDIDVEWTEAGSGPPVVLVHGLAEGKETWAVQQRDLADVHTFAYDLRGHGGTTVGDGDATLEQLGRDLLGFLETVTGPATVVGFSLGGTVALWAAAERPDLVTHAIVLGTSSVVGRAATGFYANRIAQAADTASAEFRHGMREDTAAALAVAHDQLDQVVAERLRVVGDGRGYANAAQAMAGLNAAPLTPRLADIKVHVDVVGATDDTFCPRKAADIITEALADVTYTEIPNAGHLMNIDNPDAVTAVMRTALSGRN
ncbi:MULTISPECIES: alpha/beta fold hydrolase [unclassified Nocardioides]|uniref:alpha/beta fold hydrolase n=1 Tax=unclassified Nocardioides TaxID=2615069 RepID=UPI000700AC5C|nr:MULTISPECIES: alpha/beta hydrolase [unclassified Nocardioides]KQY54438.1 alpha/beta hydrolase [Nocardioides sp. Root140]KQZ66312.1 alpha/beta hydrolase [Nocardioides sp. Root151]KRF19513.1 alpha/beta hydrolase [Nocardioides sp. Soil796]